MNRDLSAGSESTGGHLRGDWFSLVGPTAVALFSEVTEVRDALHLIASRASDEAVARDLVREMAWYNGYLERGGANRTANPTRETSRGESATW